LNVVDVRAHESVGSNFCLLFWHLRKFQQYNSY
jgi:hypothetical protein